MWKQEPQSTRSSSRHLQILAGNGCHSSREPTEWLLIFKHRYVLILKKQVPGKPTKNKSMVKIFSCFKNISLLCCFRKASPTKSIQKKSFSINQRPQTSREAQPEFLLPRRGGRASEGKTKKKMREEMLVRLKVKLELFFNWLAQDMFIIGCIFGVHDWFHFVSFMLGSGCFMLG